MQLLDCLFAVSAAEDGISAGEEAEVRRVASELHLDHADFIEARGKFRRRGGLRDPERP
jgi:uncharacterized tellurite resistance protein B-like protein